LEVAFGTGNLHLDLHAAGYAPVGIDLSPQMHAVTRAKFRAAGRGMPRLARARAQALPFADGGFSTVVMTFPPGFVREQGAMPELWRVLEPGGSLLWVDAPLVYPRDAASRWLGWLFGVTGGCAGKDEIADLLRETEGGTEEGMFRWRVEPVERARSRIHVFVGIKNGA
jgi:SAM-dependent methyltransferase